MVNFATLLRRPSAVGGLHPINTLSMNNDNQTNIEKSEQSLLPLLKTCWTYLQAYWKWFLLSLIVCYALGRIYLERQPRIFSRQAVMLIEDAQDGSSGGIGGSRKSRSSVSTLMELNGISVGGNLKNEIFILTSRRLMERVVDTLHLDEDYTTRESLHRTTLYNNRPFQFDFAQRAQVPTTFDAIPQDDGTVVLKNFPAGPDKGDKSQTFTLKDGQTVSTPAGKLTLRVNKRAFAEFPAGKTIQVSHWPVKLAAAYYAGRVSANEYDKESSLIVLSCRDDNPARAEDLLRAVFEAYKQDVVDNKNRVAQNTAAFIDARIDLIGKDLSTIEESLAQFKSSNRMVDFQQNAQLFLNESSTARKQSIQLETELAVAGYLADFLQDRTKRHETVPVLSLGETSVATLIVEYNRCMIERNRMVENSSTETPAVRNMDNQLQAQRSAILASLNSYLEALRLQLTHARATEQAIMGQMQNVPGKQREGLDILRQQELKSSLYTYLLNKREEVALRMAVEEANVRMVEEPLGSTAPISPRRTFILIVSLLIGIGIPAGILYVMHLFDTTIKSRREVESVCNIPIVGEIPEWSGTSPNGLIAGESNDSPIMEAFRMLRYGINFMRHSAKVYVVTSSIPGQGKTFISKNLAYILGTSDKRVLYIDTDIRKRTASRSLGNSTGLTALLSDDEHTLSLTDFIIPNALDDMVDFLPVGKMPPNPTELLMSERFDEIVNEARQLYDYVVIDTTPVFAVADASVVARVADVTLFALRMSKERKDFLPLLNDMYKKRKFHNLCCVINGSNARHGYNYGYGYGYYREYESRKRNHLKQLFRRKR